MERSLVMTTMEMLMSQQHVSTVSGYHNVAAALHTATQHTLTTGMFMVCVVLPPSDAATGIYNNLLQSVCLDNNIGFMCTPVLRLISSSPCVLFCV